MSAPGEIMHMLTQQLAPLPEIKNDPFPFNIVQVTPFIPSGNSRFE